MPFVACLYFGCLLLVYGCVQPAKTPVVRALSMDSSLAIIMESTRMLTDSGVPWFWPRDFTTKEIASHYTGYVLQNKPGDLIRGMHRHPVLKRTTQDSSFGELAEFASYIDLQPIRPEAVRSLSNKRITLELTDGFKGDLTNDELGCLKVSPVVINPTGDRAVFFLEAHGEVYSVRLFCVRHKRNEWRVVQSKLIVIS